MTYTTAITLNAVLAVLVSYGVVFVLGHGIHRGRFHQHAEVRPLPVSEQDELAA